MPKYQLQRDLHIEMSVNSSLSGLVYGQSRPVRVLSDY